MGFNSGFKGLILWNDRRSFGPPPPQLPQGGWRTSDTWQPYLREVCKANPNDAHTWRAQCHCFPETNWKSRGAELGLDRGRPVDRCGDGKELSEYGHLLPLALSCEHVMCQILPNDRCNVLNHCNEGFSHRITRPLQLSDISMANRRCRCVCALPCGERALKPQLHYRNYLGSKRT
jgi:hypothetical protein